MSRLAHSARCLSIAARAARTLEALAEARLSPDAKRAAAGCGVRQQPLSGRLALRETGSRWRISSRPGPQTVAECRDRARRRRWRALDDEAQAMAELRARQAARRAGHRPGRHRRRSGTWKRSPRALTRFADACVSGALRFLLREAGDAARHGGARRRSAGSHDRPHRSGDGQIRRLRAQLFQRHRSGGVLRRANVSLRQARRCARRGGRYRARAGQADGRDHRRRLCLPHRSASAARCRRHPGRDLDRGGRSLLRRPWARIGNAPP